MYQPAKASMTKCTAMSMYAGGYCGIGTAGPAVSVGYGGEALG